MNIIDTHAHLFAEDFQDDLNEVVLHARQAGVVKALLPNIDETTIDDLKAAVSHDPGFFCHDGTSSYQCDQRVGEATPFDRSGDQDAQLYCSR